MINVNIWFKNFENVIRVLDFQKKAVKDLCGERVIDVLMHFPYDVQLRTCNLDVAINRNDLERQVMFNEIITIEDFAPGPFKTSPIQILATGKSGRVSVLYFHGNKAYLKKKYSIGKTLFVSGKAQVKNGEVNIIHPDIVSTDTSLYKETVEPVYRLTSSLTNLMFTGIVRRLLHLMPDTEEWIPDEVVKKYGWPSFRDALLKIHYPQCVDDVRADSKMVKRIAFDEMLANKMCMLAIKEKLKSVPCSAFPRNNVLADKIQLPFELTHDQKHVLDEIFTDLESGMPMNRLVQGDVGSGKTVVAFLAALSVISSGFQVAFIAPTEALATQHFATISRYAEQIGISIDLIIAKNRRYRKTQIDNLMNNKTQIVIGTHALLEDNIKFAKLGLIIIDEQQRFGVMQRMKLIEKGYVMHALYLSATPIPRTMMLSVFGDLDLSIISSKPAMRKPIQTAIVSAKKLPDIVEKVKNFNSQVYWICPYIEQSESKSITDATTRFAYLKNALGSVGLLHGKMKPVEKDAVLNDFRDNKIKVLVATTVIEVGIDVPNANAIIIENAEQFGLSQLHQLRGRVGRSDQQAYCILMYGYPISAQAIERLQLIKQSNDGFELSEADLKLRGHGDLLGTHQSGFDSFRIFDFRLHSELLEIANNVAIRIPKNEILLGIFNRRDNIKLM